MPSMEWLTNVVDAQMRVDIGSPVNDFIKDFTLKIDNIMLTCILKKFPHSGTLLSVQAL